MKGVSQGETAFRASRGLRVIRVIQGLMDAPAPPAERESTADPAPARREMPGHRVTRETEATGANQGSRAKICALKPSSTSLRRGIREIRERREIRGPTDTQGLKEERAIQA